MTDVDTMQALARIERALARLEAVEHVDARPASIVSDPGLMERHDRLRARVRDTLERLDTLIAEGGA